MNWLKWAGWDRKCKQEVRAIQQEGILTPNALASFYRWGNRLSQCDECQELIRQLEKASAY